MGEVHLIGSFEVPVDGGRGTHLAPHLTGDATQFEAFVSDGLCVRVHLHAGSTAQRCCGARKDEEHTAVKLRHRLAALCPLQVTGVQRLRPWLARKPVSQGKG